MMFVMDVHRPALPGACLLTLALALLFCGTRCSAAPAEHRVQPGDVLEVVLWHEDRKIVEARADASGAIAVPLAGTLNVKGQTLTEVARRITQALEPHVKRPRVTVTLKLAHPQAGVYILGAVQRPGPIEFLDGMRIKDALGLVGGLLPTADAAHATLTGVQRGTQSVDLKALLTGDATQDIALALGDVLHVPARDVARELLTVFVVGQVARPGSVALAPGARLSDAITAAGGPSDLAALKRATLSRKGETLPIDLEQVLRQGDLAGNLPLQDGDVILVPEQRNRVTLVGEFQKPGTYPFREGDTLTGAVALGGGSREEADLHHARLIRDGKETEVDLDAMLKAGDLSGDLALRDGDVLILPRASRTVTLLGEFQKPGTYSFTEGDTLAQAVALAQGPTAAADLRRAVLKRGGKEIPVDLYALLKEGSDAQDRALQDGDTLFVPAGTRVLTYGAFQKPGPVVVTEGMGLFEVLAAAGGTSKDARLEKAQIARLVNGERVPIRLDLKAALKKGSPPPDFRFVEGDVLYVPEKGKELNWQGLVSAAYMLTLAADRIFE